jgi:hypothetical protein
MIEEAHTEAVTSPDKSKGVQIGRVWMGVIFAVLAAYGSLSVFFALDPQFKLPDGLELLGWTFFFLSFLLAPGAIYIGIACVFKDESVPVAVATAVIGVISLILSALLVTRM